ncbi:YggS family pyridoxal phosphate-dependent enzyme [Agriterribacter sp.]|uniref:YggS family pyridoxal phosphate-dependent enzyme n=1 Tax=Agriterribacter sp. TaxID=2821509 RepID=UPI002B967569|nr:YggS family pyridoxal phosphate-dependent enzyme [Agriterribacter sp.]HRP56548.1 YggS family pyridoxal phosphate-dependent enzyme [Agriterribacter sp.]
MAANIEAYQSIRKDLDSKKVILVAVSKTRPVGDVQTLYDMGQRDFGENYVQELVEKQKQLPGDIRWHFIGHLQRNKVKDIADFVHLIHGVDSQRLLVEINKQALKRNRTIPVLLQVHIAREETKFGLDENELGEIMKSLPGLNNVAIKGLMGMASLTDDRAIIRKEFQYLRSLYDQISLPAEPALRPPLTTLSIGMSNDYTIAIEEGSNMVRLGSLLFGARN